MVSLKLAIMLSVWSDINYFDQNETIQSIIYNSGDILVITFPQNVTLKDKNYLFKLGTNMSKEMELTLKVGVGFFITSQLKLTTIQRAAVQL